MDTMFCDNDIEFEQTSFKYVYNSMNNLIVGTLVYGLGLTVGAWFVSRFLWDSEIVLENIEEPKIKEVLYEDKYPLDNYKDLSGNKPTNTTIIENTPEGSVIMSYNYDKEGFEYWSNTKNIKYNFLETVARKFVKMNFCTDLYIDRRENIKQQNEELDRQEEKEKEKKKENEEKNAKIDKEFEEIEEEDSVFVKSKLSLKEKQKKEVIDRTKIAAIKANKYIRVGKCSDFKWLKKMEKRDKKKKISFNDFKNNFC